LQFVEQVLREGDCGIVADFTNTADIVRCVDALTVDVALRRRLGENARAHFADRYNWNVVAAPFYASISALLTARIRHARTHVASVLRPAVPTLTFEPPQETREPASRPLKEFIRVLWRLIPRRVRLILVSQARRVLTRALSAL